MACSPGHNASCGRPINASVKAAVQRAFRRFTVILAWVFAAVFVPLLILVRQLERTNVFDSIGTWYTIIVTTTFAVPIAGPVALLIWLGWRARGVRRPADKHGGTDA